MLQMLFSFKVVGLTLQKPVELYLEIWLFCMNGPSLKPLKQRVYFIKQSSGTLLNDLRDLHRIIYFDVN